MTKLRTKRARRIYFVQLPWNQIRNVYECTVLTVLQIRYFIELVFQNKDDADRKSKVGPLCHLLLYKRSFCWYMLVVIVLFVSFLPSKEPDGTE